MTRHAAPAFFHRMFDLLAVASFTSFSEIGFDATREQETLNRWRAVLIDYVRVLPEQIDQFLQFFLAICLLAFRHRFGNASLEMVF